MAAVGGCKLATWLIINRWQASLRAKVSQFSFRIVGMKLNNQSKTNKKEFEMINKQLLLAVCATIVIGLMIVVGLNLLMAEANITTPNDSSALIISQPEWDLIGGYAIAQRLDNGERIKVFLSDRQIRFGTKVKIVMAEPMVNPYPKAILDQEIK